MIVCVILVILGDLNFFLLLYEIKFNLLKKLLVLICIIIMIFKISYSE